MWPTGNVAERRAAMSEHGMQRMSERDYKSEAPDVYKALIELGRAVDGSGLEKPLIELVKIRVSQINGCAYCLQLHLNLARRVGLDEAKIGLAAVWHEAAGVFTPREQAALAWADALSRMPSAEVSDGVYELASRAFEPAELAYLTAAVANINAWNRIAGALRWTPPLPKAQAPAGPPK
jgi:AhpD family alkylhydroperoxidase